MDREIAALFVDVSSLPGAADGTRVVPSEFRLLRAGPNASTKGSYVFDEVAAQCVMAAWQSSGISIMGDYEHQSLARPPIEAPASCMECQLELRNGELWATNVKWTDRAASMLAAGEYRYFSPAFYFDPETMRVLELINFALTNTPALRGLTPLVAATAHTEEQMEPEKKIAALTADNEALKAKIASLESDKTQLGEVASLKGEVATLSAKQGEILSAVGAKSVPDALGKIEALKEKAATVETLTADLKKREQADSVGQARRGPRVRHQGRPHQARSSRGAPQALAQRQGRGHRRQARVPHGLRDGSPAHREDRGSDGVAKPPESKKGETALSEGADVPVDTHKFIAHLGQTPADVAAYKADPKKWLADQEAKRRPSAASASGDRTVKTPFVA